MQVARVADRPPSTLRVLASVLLPFTGGYFLSYIFRTVNAVIAPHLVRDLNLTATDLGLLTAAYFLTFAAFQLPLGALLDRFGPRRVQSGLLVVMAAGAVLFSLGRDQTELVAARALIGLGASASLMASLKAITQWFPKERWALINGAFIGFGGLGALVATTPLEAALQITDWRGVFVGLSGAALVVSAAIFLIVPERPVEPSGQSLFRQMSAIGTVLGSARFWRVTPLATTLYATAMSLQGLWLGPFSRDVLGSDPAHNLQLAAVGFTVGAVATGLVTELMVRIGFTLHAAMGSLTLLYLVALVPFIYPFIGDHPAIWVLFGLTANIAAISYAIVPAYFPLAFAGRANTALNLVVFGFAFLTQYLMGAVIDHWPRTAAGGYAPEGYFAAFGGGFALVVVTLAWYVVPLRQRQ
jgi:MFS family permease